MDEVDGVVLVRGDKREITVSDLIDGQGNTAVFNDGDILRFTIKRSVAGPALIAKSSADTVPGITFTSGTSEALIEILGSDWDLIVVRQDMPIVWDLQLAVSGDPDNIQTLAKGRGTITADVTQTAP